MELVDQFRGCLLGMAVGDAFGVAVERLAPPQVVAEFGLLRDMLGGGRQGLRAGRTTAVTELVLCVLDAYNVRGGFDPQEICDCLAEAARTPRQITDQMTASALSQLAAGWQFETAAALAYDQASPSERISAGALPRIVPAGLLHYHDDLHLIGQSRVICGFTHQAELPKLCCVAFNLALQHMLLVGTGGLLEELLIWVEPRSPELHAWLRVVPRLRPDRLDVSGSAPATLQAALWAALFSSDFEEGVVLLARRGGEAPTVCAVAGALLGARFGKLGIPEDWLETLQQAASLDRLAQRLYMLSQQASLPVAFLEETAPVPILRSPPDLPE